MIDNGERMIPASHKGQMVYGEHIVRYDAVAPLAKDLTVLDIACGSGYGSQKLAAFAKSVIGVDINEESIAYAATQFPAKNLEFIVGSATNIPLKENSVDMVVSFETIEHVQEYKKYLAEIRRVLKPSGTYIVSTPNDREFSENNIFHVHEFVLEELEPLLSEYFKHTETYYQGTWLYNALLSKEDFQSEWTADLATARTFSQSVEKAIYFTTICSDGTLPKLDSRGAISAPWSAREQETVDHLYQETAKNNATLLSQLTEQEKASQEKVAELTTVLEAKQKELDGIYDSRSWKVAQSIHKLRHPNS